MKPPQCPVCCNNTTRHPGQAERCPTCRIVIVRNARGEADYAFEARPPHRTVYLRRPNSAPGDHGPRRAEIHANTPDRFATHDPTDKPADPGAHLGLVVPFGRGTKENDAA